MVAIAFGWGGVVYAANNSVQGAKKEEGGFDGDAPTAILIEANSGSVLFEKNADELRAPSSMMKLMTAETVFHAIKQGEVKLPTNIASAKTPGAGRRPQGLDDVRSHSQQDLRGRSLARRHHSQRQRCLHRPG
jgi:D-alanyl-D-alanine carboxypeptidase